MKYSLNGEWKYKVETGESTIIKDWWKLEWIEKNFEKLDTIDLPNNWNVLPGLEKYEGIVWFFKEITNIPSDFSVFDLYIQFDAVNYYSRVWLNEYELGGNEGGFLPFKLKILPEFMKFGENNYIAIRVENFRKKDRIPCKTFDWYNWGGIYRNIDFLILDKFRVKWAGITTKLSFDGKTKAIAEIKYEIVDNREEFIHSMETPHELTWNLYYLGNLSTLKLIQEEQSIRNKKSDLGSVKEPTDSNENDLTDSNNLNKNEQVSDFEFPEGVTIFDDEDFAETNENYSNDFSSDSDSVGDLDILDNLLSEPIIVDDSKIAQRSEENRETPGVLIRTGMVSEKSIKNSFTIEIEEPKLWDPENPELYKFELILKGSREPYSSNFGFKEIKTIGTNLFLNNKRIRLYGVSLHEEIYLTGRVMTKDQRRADVLAIKKLGFNALRSAHYPHDSALYECCSEEGLLSLEEIPLYWGCEFENPKVIKLAAKMFREMIRRDFNQPSIIMWSTGNEIPVEQFSCSNLITTLMNLGRKLDDSRLISYVSMRTFTDYLRRRSDINCLNLYIGWYYLSPHNFNFAMDAIHYTNRKKPWIITEFGAGGKFGFHKPLKNFDKFSEERQASVISHEIKVMNSKEYIAGYFIWIYRDFKSHMRTGKFQEGFNRKGIVDEKNNKKLIAKILPKVMKQKLDGNRDHHLIAGLFQTIGFPLFKIAAIISGKFQGNVTDVGDNFYTNQYNDEKNSS